MEKNNIIRFVIKKTLFILYILNILYKLIIIKLKKKLINLFCSTLKNTLPVFFKGLSNTKILKSLIIINKIKT